MAAKRTKPTARELEKTGAATLANKYQVPVSQIVLWRKEARERSGLEPAVRTLKRTQQTQDVLADMKRRDLTIADLDPDFPDRELLERLLSEDPGPASDPATASSPMIDPGPGYFNVRLTDGGDPDETLTSPLYTAHRPKIPAWWDPDPMNRVRDTSSYAPLLWAILLAVFAIGLIASGVWK